MDLSALDRLVQVLGIILAPFALWRSRTSQGAFAWVVSLIAFPYVAVPAFAVFGCKRFHGYVIRRQKLDAAAVRELRDMHQQIKEVAPQSALRELASVVHKSGQVGFTTGNVVDLLVDGEATFAAMLSTLRSAKRYILFQTYILRDDHIGREFRDALAEKAKEGVRVYCIYDRIGSSFSRAFIKSFQAAGVMIAGFEGNRKILKNIQINFRNHRKLLIVDGDVVLLGGHNVGDDYLGRWKNVGTWRDTHMRLAGPAAAAAQLSFIKDWFWVKEVLIDVDWNTPVHSGGCDALVFHTGPADQHETCNLAHIALINAAKKRIWIATPYFVPPDGLSNALALAALRGVDVRIILPTMTDNHMAKLASEVHVAKLQQAGVQFWRYQAGFLHQKVMLCDELAGVVGSVNLDARSFFINFEITALSDQRQFLQDLETMLLRDFARSQLIAEGEFHSRPFYYRFAALAATLGGPML